VIVVDVAENLRRIIGVDHHLFRQLALQAREKRIAVLDVDLVDVTADAPGPFAGQPLFIVMPFGLRSLVGENPFALFVDDQHI